MRCVWVVRQPRCLTPKSLSSLRSSSALCVSALKFRLRLSQTALQPIEPSRPHFTSMPAAIESAPLDEEPRSFRWDLALVLAMGGALLLSAGRMPPLTWLAGTSCVHLFHERAPRRRARGRDAGSLPPRAPMIPCGWTISPPSNTGAGGLPAQPGAGQHAGNRDSATPTPGWSFRFENIIADQDLVVACNGKVLERSTTSRWTLGSALVFVRPPARHQHRDLHPPALQPPRV